MNSPSPQEIFPPTPADGSDAERPIAVLLVDDRAENLLALETILDFPSLKLVTAQSGAEALRRLLAQDFALILLDVHMPGMDGFETAALVRQRARSRHTPIIFVTAFGHSDSALARGYDIGAADFLFKPITPAVVKAKVNVFVELYRKTAQIERQLEQIYLAARRETEQRLNAERQRWETENLRKEVELEKHRVMELERVDRERRSSEARFRSLVTATSQIIWVADADGQFTTEQPAWTRFTGQSFEELRGLGWLSAIHPDERDGVLKAWTEAVRTRSLYEVEHHLRRHDGVYVPMSVRATPVLGEGNSGGEWVGAHANISEWVRAQFELRHAKEEAEAANLAKSQFIAGMSHELRTPLNAIIMYSELLQEDARDRNLDGLAPDLERIRAAGLHLLALVNGVLDLAKIEAGKTELDPETFDVAQMVRDVAATVQPLVLKRFNKFEIECAPDVGSIHGDLTKIRQILFNLLANASKFTERGFVRLRVARETAEETNSFVFQVSDTGIGMTAEQLGKLFQPFTQADASMTRKYGGTGLGLAISKRFCEMMGGDIVCVSELGTGSIFTLRLPAQTRASVPPIPAASTSARDNNAATASPPATDANHD